MSEAQYKRVLIKVSGEALAADKKTGLDFDFITRVANAVKTCSDMGVEIGIVVGGGNFWRGVKDGGGKVERTRADYMGMLATTMNALALADVLQGVGVEARVQTSIDMIKIAEPYTRNKAVSHLNKGRVVIFACGTGNPFFSTDTGAVLKAAEIGAEVILLAKNIDGVYDADPAKVKDAKKFDSITYDEVLARGLAVMDTAATALAKENNIPVIVFAVKEPDNIIKVLCGEKIGSYVGVK
ncbi:MAG: UMP kinase [Clostridia bacterium]|nr:UMP kinase [Clostridia bacterium]